MAPHKQGFASQGRCDFSMQHNLFLIHTVPFSSPLQAHHCPSLSVISLIKAKDKEWGLLGVQEEKVLENRRED